MGPVRSIMNPTIVYLREGSRPTLALKPILEFGITAVPVLDESEFPIGMVSLRDLVASPEERPATLRPVLSVRDDASIEDAARTLADQSVHHLVVVDAVGRAVGMVSALDVLRAYAGLPPHHPQAITDFADAGRR